MAENLLVAFFLLLTANADNLEQPPANLVAQAPIAGVQQRITDKPDENNRQAAPSPEEQRSIRQRQESAIAGRRLATQRRPSINYSRLSSVPYMIGDTVAGGCGALEVGGLSPITIAHPTYGCSRLNIAENNSPYVQDRAYLNYRHFHNASEVDVFSLAPAGGRNAVNINSYTLGLERLMSEKSSLELRLPIIHQLTSDVRIDIATGPNWQLPLNDTNVNLGNLGLIAKFCLAGTESIYLSAGSSLNLPTAPDVTVRFREDDNAFQFYNGQRQPIGPPIPLRGQNDTILRNETINLSPFVAAEIKTFNDCYLLGFLQLDVPLNESHAETSGQTFIANQLVSTYDTRGKIAQQMLLRLNLGGGMWIFKDPQRRYIQSVRLQSEFHYSTTLNNADLLPPTLVAPDIGFGAQILRLGNIANRVDSLNGLIGIQTLIGKSLIGHGFALPLRSGADKGYDFEYSLSLNRLF